MSNNNFATIFFIVYIAVWVGWIYVNDRNDKRKMAENDKEAKQRREELEKLISEIDAHIAKSKAIRNQQQ